MKTLDELKKEAIECFDALVKNDANLHWNYFWLGYLEHAWETEQSNKN